MKKIIMILLVTMFFVGCAPKTGKVTLENEGTENIIEEVILYEDVTNYWE